MIVKLVKTLSAPNFTWVVVSYDDGKVRPRGASLPSVRFCAFKTDTGSLYLEKHNAVQSGKANELVGTVEDMGKAKELASDYVSKMGRNQWSGALERESERRRVARQSRLDADWSRQNATLPQLELF
jgi:hypothetical protein